MRQFSLQESLYIGMEVGVIRVPTQHCKRHITKQACIEAMDPYCGWNELKLACTPPPDGNPLTPYWHQQVIGCPSFTHPGKLESTIRASCMEETFDFLHKGDRYFCIFLVPGGWSDWSAWIPCNQATTNGESTDQCMCSTRQCTNPAPQNSGAYCEGVSTLVSLIRVA